MLLHESTTVTRDRLAVHALLDQEHLAWDRARKTAPKDEPIRSVKVEARRAVNLKYDADPAHAIYMAQRGGVRSTPACQSPDCDECHRVLALVRLRELCSTREEYLPLLNWILDPAFLA